MNDIDICFFGAKRRKARRRRREFVPRVKGRDGVIRCFLSWRAAIISVKGPLHREIKGS